MTDKNFITANDPKIAAAIEELMPIIEQRLARAAGRRQVSFMLFAGVEDEGGVSIAVNADDPRDVVMAVMKWGRVMEENIARVVRQTRN